MIKLRTIVSSKTDEDVICSKFTSRIYEEKQNKLWTWLRNVHHLFETMHENETLNVLNWSQTTYVE